MIFYDFEVFKEDWLVVLKDVIKKTTTKIVNRPEQLSAFYNSNKNRIFIGYNNKRYDQYIMKAILCGFNPKEVNDFIIVEGNPGYKFSKLFNEIQMVNFDLLPTIVPIKSLKALEGFMGHNIKESSINFRIDRKLTQDEIEETLQYCEHDVNETMLVFLNQKSEFDSVFGLIKMFDLPLNYISKTKAQLSSIILEATRKSRDDEFELIIPDTLRLNKYKYILNWYLDEKNRDYKNTLEVNIAGVPHKFAWGGIHGAIPKYSDTGYFVNVDVASYYPAEMIEYNFLSRNVRKPEKYRQIRDERLVLKKAKDTRNKPLKVVLNSTYGAMKDKYNSLYDPRQANNVCVGGQLLLLDLIEKLEKFCKIIQSNTDGVLVKLQSEKDFDILDDICYEWEQRTRMQLEFEHVEKVFQKDVNNYVTVDPDGNYKSKGAYVKKLTNLDYDLAIINKSLINYFLHGIHPKETILKCNNLRDFQKIVKISNKYKYAMHNGKILNEKTFRVFASNKDEDGIIYKCKENKNPEKFANTPEKCFIDNSDITNKKPNNIDHNWYIDLAIKRLRQFGVDI